MTFYHTFLTKTGLTTIETKRLTPALLRFHWYQHNSDSPITGRNYAKLNEIAEKLNQKLGTDLLWMTITFNENVGTDWIYNHKKVKETHKIIKKFLGEQPGYWKNEIDLSKRLHVHILTVNPVRNKTPPKNTTVWYEDKEKEITIRGIVKYFRKFGDSALKRDNRHKNTFSNAEAQWMHQNVHNTLNNRRNPNLIGMNC